MDIYGVKKNILELEQVFLDMTKVSYEDMSYQYLLDDGIQYKCVGKT